MAIVKIREVIGVSPESFDAALKEVLKHEVGAGKNVTGLKVKAMTVEVKDGRIVEYKVDTKVAYKWEKEPATT